MEFPSYSIPLYFLYSLRLVDFMLSTIISTESEDSWPASDSLPLDSSSAEESFPEDEEEIGEGGWFFAMMATRSGLGDEQELRICGDTSSIWVRDWQRILI